jgi:DNA-binding LacI/PurR family transcriptional regulator
VLTGDSVATTLKEIAAALGLSPVSVSKALRGSGRISEETRRRVMEAARKMRYRPHGAARSMREGRTGIIGLIYSTEQTKGNLPLEQLSAIQEALSENSFDLMLAEVPTGQLGQPGKTSSLLRHWMADGMLINHQIALPEAVNELVEGDHVPAIWINSKQPHNCVFFDDYGAGRRAAEHLLQLGHRRIAYLDYGHPAQTLYAPYHYSVLDRYLGYEHAMQAAGLQPRLIMAPDGIGAGERVAACRQWLAQPDRPTAVIAYSTNNTTPLQFAAAEIGLKLPRDLSLIAFSGVTPPDSDLRLTLMLQSYRRLGQQSVHRLMGRLAADAGAQASQEPLAIPIDLYHGQSCVPPPGQ